VKSRSQQAEKVANHTRDCRWLEQICAVFEFAIETAVLLNHLQRQIEFCHATVKRQFLNVKSGQRWQLLYVLNEHDLEGRRVSAVAFRPQMPHDLFYRNVLVR
jgi:hypothetical protein